MTTALELDVRPILRDGGEPFGAVMRALKSLAPGQSLRLIATFRPEPLFKVMASKGFGYEATPLDGGDWQVIFTPQNAAAQSTPSSPSDPETWPDPIHYLDCSEMEPPEPMVQILTRLEAMEEGQVLFSLLGREPVFLFPELQARGHAWVGDFDAEGEAYRLMVRAGQKP